MSDMIELRDHNRPCEHAPDDWEKGGALSRSGFLNGHRVSPGVWCPGGKKPIEIDFIEDMGDCDLYHVWIKHDE